VDGPVVIHVPFEGDLNNKSSYALDTTSGWVVLKGKT
jgi:hypothetical protein